MNEKITPVQNYIIVVPYCPFSAYTVSPRLKVEKLCFWHDRKLEHLVKDENIHLFIRHANLYKPSIFPNRPELGCYAIDNHISFENGETLVQEIYYNNELIFCRS